MNGLLDAIPPYFSQAVIAPGRRLASLAFGIKLMSLDEQQRVIEAMRAGLHPPRGVNAQLVGLSVLAAQANAQVASPWRRLQTLLARTGGGRAGVVDRIRRRHPSCVDAAGADRACERLVGADPVCRAGAR